MAYFDTDGKSDNSGNARRVDFFSSLRRHGKELLSSMSVSDTNDASFRDPRLLIRAREPSDLPPLYEGNRDFVTLLQLYSNEEVSPDAIARRHPWYIYDMRSV